MKKDITLKMVSTRYEVDAATSRGKKIEVDTEPQVIELFTEATMEIKDGKVDICYDESATSGMDGSTTHLIFELEKPDTLTMYRAGTAGPTMIFSPGLRHTCTYHTPVMPFKMELVTRTLVNNLLTDGTLDIDYTTALASSGHARTFMQVTIFEDKE